MIISIDPVRNLVVAAWASGVSLDELIEEIKSGRQLRWTNAERVLVPAPPPADCSRKLDEAVAMSDAATHIEPTSEELKLIELALGLGAYTEKPYRKYYVAPSSGSSRALCERMTGKGWLVPFGMPFFNGMQTFHVTAAGAALVGHKLP